MTTYLMNTTIMPNNNGTYKATPITTEAATNIIHNPDVKKISAIGHDATAEAFSTVTNADIKVNRIRAELKDGDKMLCLKIRDRLPEGKVLTIDELNEIGFDFVLVTYSV